MLLPHFVTATALSAAILAPGHSPGAPQETAPTVAEHSPQSSLSAGSTYRTIAPGDSFTLVVQVALEPGWHSYWVNGGDAGLPLELSWSLPDGVSAGEPRFPIPRLIPTPPLMSYGYNDTLRVLVSGIATRELPYGELNLVAHASWLVCSDVCLPAADSAVVRILVQSGERSADPFWTGAAAATERALPTALAPNTVARAYATRSGYTVEVQLTPELSGDALPYFFVAQPTTVEHAQPQRAGWRDGMLTLQLPRSEFATEQAGRLTGIITTDATNPDAPAYAIDVQVGVAPAASGGALIGAVLFAFIGGVLLNAMPCVFPVLSLKVLSFITHSNGSTRLAREHGLSFAGGVVLSFWLLAGLLFALREGGAAVGWGFQLQSPTVVALLALALFALALNLSGLLEFGYALTRLGALGQGSRRRDSFLTGVLAVVVATPCTAPFMGGALGFALVQPMLTGMVVFTALALGLAAPYVLLSLRPSLLRSLPAPGPWMRSAREILAFPMYLTVVWLVWVLAQQSGVNAAALLLTALVFFGFAAWVLSAHPAPLTARRILAAMAFAGAITLAVRAAQGGDRPGEAGSNSAEHLWEDYTPGRVAELRGEGRAVFVDFTAAWCLSCQVNERVALRNADVLRAFDENGVALLRADWTARDPAIAMALQSFGRSGVPLYVLYHPGSGADPEVLPAILTPSLVVNALARGSAQRR